MKKLFVSVPMKGKTDEDIKNNIKKMHKLAEEKFGEKLLLIDSFINYYPPKGCNIPMYYLGKSIQLLSTADYYIGIDVDKDCYSGCYIENLVSKCYMCPDNRYIINKKEIGE